MVIMTQHIIEKTWQEKQNLSYKVSLAILNV